MIMIMIMIMIMKLLFFFNRWGLPVYQMAEEGVPWVVVL